MAGRPGTGRLDDGLVLRGWLDRAVPALEAARERIDAVNVFPVPDGDTGTNVLLTVRGAAEEVAARPAAAGDGPQVLQALARGALLSARGNSGVILSRYLGGLAGAAPGSLAEALRVAAEAARAAVAAPEDGTVLTVAAGVASATRHAAAAGADDASALAAGVAAGREGLARVSATHPVLRSARVVDAGACALLVLLDALAAALAGRDGAVDVGWLTEHARPGGAARGGGPGDAGSAPPGGTPPEAGAGASAGPSVYEVVALLGAADAATVAGALTGALGSVGDAVAVVPGDGLVTAHVHAPVPADAAAVLAASGAAWTATVRALLGGARPVVACTASATAAEALADTGAVVALLPAGTSPAAARDAVRRAAGDAAAGGGPVTVLPGGLLGPGDLDPSWVVVDGAVDDHAVLAALGTPGVSRPAVAWVPASGTAGAQPTEAGA
ncbi:DAK2 domain-containing protein [Cellulomonas sp. C5510]|uniref:DAK2 domain-containing protein n=1 Tax=Cellulomonas sp. C5510 TaxID=2871170 RepID=UPI001C94BE9A|nr:DAK2 domain-containing protein [Cellulomonas sp. C5510]QZN86634.1 DAK2 domain-containing protein [Cellulomonas sp. C5510]